MAFGFFKRLDPPRPAPIRERMHDVAGRSLPLRIVENDRARRLTLRIDAGGQGIRITVPPGMAPREVDRFLHRHQGWLEQHWWAEVGARFGPGQHYLDYTGERCCCSCRLPGMSLSFSYISMEEHRSKQGLSASNA